MGAKKRDKGIEGGIKGEKDMGHDQSRSPSKNLLLESDKAPKLRRGGRELGLENVEGYGNIVSSFSE